MSKKSIPISRKPTKNVKNVDEWVTNRGNAMVDVNEQSNEVQKMKRLTIDVPQDLHARIKVSCAQKGIKMADRIRELLEREF